MTVVGHCHYAGLYICPRLGNCLLKVGGKGGDSAAARERVTNERQAVGGTQEEADGSGGVQFTFMMGCLCVAKLRKCDLECAES